jgi:ribosomal protein S27E
MKRTKRHNIECPHCHETNIGVSEDDAEFNCFHCNKGVMNPFFVNLNLSTEIEE